jgi:hypothetical protein
MCFNTNSLQKGRNNMNKENILSKISKMSKEELINLAWNTSDVKILNKLAENENYEVRRAVAGNEYTSADMLVMLASDKDWCVRSGVAWNENTSVDVLVMLAKDETSHVREMVAGIANTPIDVLAVLAQDEDYWVRRAVALNKNTPIEILAVLAKDEDEDVRKAVAENKNTSVETLAMLTKDNDIWISETAEIALKKRNKNLGKKKILTLDVTTLPYDVRMAIAENEESPLELLEVLAYDSDGDVREEVAKNKSVTAHILDKMADYELANELDQTILCVISDHPLTTTKTLNKILNFKEWGDEDKRNEVLTCLAVNPNLSAAMLEKLAHEDLDDYVKKCVAENPSTSVKTLEFLAYKYEDEYVNVPAKEALEKRGIRTKSNIER